jgi:hypothetical protein
MILVSGRLGSPSFFDALLVSTPNASGTSTMLAGYPVSDSRGLEFDVRKDDNLERPLLLMLKLLNDDLSNHNGTMLADCG